MHRVSKKEFLSMIQQFAALQCISAGTMRGLERGILKCTRDYLGRLNLKNVPKASRVEFANWLDVRTTELVRTMRRKHLPWGIARKALNLFLRDCLYNHYLREAYRLDLVERWLEIPLDSVTAKALKRLAGRGVLPKWPGLKHLCKRTSDVFQAYASQYTEDSELPARVFLDNYLWLKNR